MTCMPKAYTCIQCSVSGCSSDTHNSCYHHKLCIHACMPTLYMHVYGYCTHTDTALITNVQQNDWSHLKHAAFCVRRIHWQKSVYDCRFGRTLYMLLYCVNVALSHVKGDVVYFWDRVMGWFIHIASNGMIYETIYSHPYIDSTIVLSDDVHVCGMCMKLYIRNVRWRVVHGEKVLKNNRWKTSPIHCSICILY